MERLRVGTLKRVEIGGNEVVFYSGGAVYYMTSTGDGFLERVEGLPLLGEATVIGVRHEEAWDEDLRRQDTYWIRTEFHGDLIFRWVSFTGRIVLD